MNSITSSNSNCQIIRLLQRPEDIEVRLLADISSNDIPDINTLMSDSNPLLLLDDMVYVKKGEFAPMFRGFLTEAAIETLRTIDPRGIDASLTLLRLPPIPQIQMPNVVIPLLLTLLEDDTRYVVGGQLLYDPRSNRYFFEAVRMIPFTQPANGGANE